MISEDSILGAAKFAEPAHTGETKKMKDPKSPDNEVHENLSQLIIMNINKKMKKALVSPSLREARMTSFCSNCYL
jgi:hypothetical protein